MNDKAFDYVFERARWNLDGMFSVLFAVCMSYFIQRGTDSGRLYIDRMLVTVAIGVCAYTSAWILGNVFRRPLKWPSWLWIAVFGAFLRTSVTKMIAFPSAAAHLESFGESGSNFRELFYRFVIIGFVNWIFWAICGAIFILACRYIVFKIRALIGPQSGKFMP